MANPRRLLTKPITLPYDGLISQEGEMSQSQFITRSALLLGLVATFFLVAASICVRDAYTYGGFSDLSAGPPIPDGDLVKILTVGEQ